MRLRRVRLPPFRGGTGGGATLFVFVEPRTPAAAEFRRAIGISTPKSVRLGRGLGVAVFSIADISWARRVALFLDSSVAFSLAKFNGVLVGGGGVAADAGIEGGGGGGGTTEFFPVLVFFVKLIAAGAGGGGRIAAASAKLFTNSTSYFLFAIFRTLARRDLLPLAISYLVIRTFSQLFTWFCWNCKESKIIYII